MRELLVARSWRAWAMALALVACAPSTNDGETPGSASAAYTGTNTFAVTTANTLPYGAVVHFRTGRDNCTAEMIKRNVLLTAAHCFCNVGLASDVSPDVALARYGSAFQIYRKNNPPYSPPVIPDIDRVALSAPPGTTNTHQFAKLDWHVIDSHPLCANTPGTLTPEFRAGDVAILVLAKSDALSIAELPSGPIRVFTGGMTDLLANLGNPITVAGFGGGESLIAATITPNLSLSFQNSCNLFGRNCGPYWVQFHEFYTSTNPPITPLVIDSGDSGGMITAMLPDGAGGVAPAVFGVLSGFYGTLPAPTVESTAIYSPTFDNDFSNGKFIAPYLVDDDQDDVYDGTDNCAPSVCQTRGLPMSSCVNPNQEDSDRDGVGDSCDGCPYIADSDQVDTDHDGVNDWCDSCLHEPTVDQFDSNVEFEAQVHGAPPCGPADPRPEATSLTVVRPTPKGATVCHHVAFGDPTVAGSPLTKDYLTANYPGDVCDSNPLTTHEQLASPSGPHSICVPPWCYDDPTGRHADCRRSGGAFCPPGPTAGPCPVEQNNVFLASEFLAGFEPGPFVQQKQLGWSRMMGCPCMPSESDAQCEIRRCSPKSAANPSSGWFATTLAGPDDGTDPAPGFKGYFPSTHPNVATGESTWTEKWAWRYWMDLVLAPPTTVSGDWSYTPFDGLTWTWVRNYGDARPRVDDAPTISPVGDTEVTLRSFARRTKLDEFGPKTIDVPNCSPPHKSKSAHVLLPTVACLNPDLCDGPAIPGTQVQPRTILQIDASTGAFDLLAPRFQSSTVTAAISPALRRLLLDRANVWVTPSDAPEAWSAPTLGVVLRTTDSFVLSEVVFNGTMIAPRTRSIGECIDGVCLDPVVAMSGRRQEAVFFGEGRVAAGKQLRVHHTDTGLEENRTITAGAIVDPVAATYRAEDDAYYVLVRSTRHAPHPASHVALQLLRLGADLAVRPVATWHAFGQATDFGLTTAWQGNLVVSAWSATRHVVIELVFDRPLPEGHSKHTNTIVTKVGAVPDPYVDRVVFGMGALAMPAVHDFRGVYRVRELGGVVQPPELLVMTPTDDAEIDFDDQLDPPPKTSGGNGGSNEDREGHGD